jgi:acetylornithine deacetylase
MGRVLTALEATDRELRARSPVPYQGTGSLHASIVFGGRELSSYPDRCTLQMERRTVSSEDAGTVESEIRAILDRLRRDDPEFDADARVMTYRSAYSLDTDHALVRAATQAAAIAGRSRVPTGMSFWTDAAILAGAGIPSVLFGPGGAGLHSIEEYVNVEDVYVCRDVLSDIAKRVTGQGPV